MNEFSPTQFFSAVAKVIGKFHFPVDFSKNSKSQTELVSAILLELYGQDNPKYKHFQESNDTLIRSITEAMMGQLNFIVSQMMALDQYFNNSEWQRLKTLQN